MMPDTKYNDQNNSRRYDSDHDDENVFDAEEDNYNNEYEQQPPPEQAQQPPRREFKYSTANMNEQGHCRKFCLIFLLFLAMIAFMIGLSMLLKHFFFSDVSDNAPHVPERSPNDTFPEDKLYIDQVCSRGTFATDEGARCREACLPQFFECCDPFDEFDLYNMTDPNKFEDKDDSKGKITAEDLNFTKAPTMAPSASPTTAAFYNDMQAKLANCSLHRDLRGCVSYAKCQAIGKRIDPAPATLSVLCSKHQLSLDPVSCQELCKEVSCCYSEGTDNCMADHFDVCLDYAPCQNLRPRFVLETAPADLDQACFWQKPECNQMCEKAKCCGDPESSCLQDNFLACLTHAPCNGVTRTNITLAPQFSVLAKPPPELVVACDEKHELLDGELRPTADRVSTKSCTEWCEQALCCWANNPKDNCFFEDPLGCLAWE